MVDILAETASILAQAGDDNKASSPTCTRAWHASAAMERSQHPQCGCLETVMCGGLKFGPTALGQPCDTLARKSSVDGL